MINSQLVSLGKKEIWLITELEKLVYHLIGINSNVIEIYTRASLDHRKKNFQRSKKCQNQNFNDPAKLWKTVKSKINPKSSTSIYSIASDNKTLDPSVDIAKHLANRFMIALIGFSLLPSHFKRNFLNSGPKFNAFDVSKTLSQIELKCAPEYYGIPYKVFKAPADELKFPNTALFNICIETNRIPPDWKIALLRPHYKGKGENQDSETYRPISLHYPISKVFESMIAGRKYDFCESNSIFNNSQLFK